MLKDNPGGLLARCKLADTNFQEQKKELDDLRAETIRAIHGTSKQNPELLNSLVGEAESGLQAAGEALRTAHEDMNRSIESAEAIRQEYARLVNWGEMYENCSFEEKKMIVGQFIKAVRLYRGGKMEIDFNASLAAFVQFCVREEKESQVTEPDELQVPT